MLYDANGHEIALDTPGDLSLIGDQTGFDYRQAAVEVVATAKPSSALLLVTGCAMVAAMRRRCSRDPMTARLA